MIPQSLIDELEILISYAEDLATEYGTEDQKAQLAFTMGSIMGLCIKHGPEGCINQIAPKSYQKGDLFGYPKSLKEESEISKLLDL